MFVGVARLVLQIPDSGSLKAKRQILRRVTDRLKARFNASVAEVEDDNEVWQKATIAASVVSNDRRHVDEQLSKLIHFVEEMYVAPLLSREMEILSFGDALFAQKPAKEESETDALLARFAKGDRSLAEAEGLGEWERRHEQAAKLEPKARALRNLRDWEKKK